MSLMGSAAIAMWWNLDPATQPEFEDWHAHEHFPERMGVPGFIRGSRWASTEGHSFFVLYELEQYEVLTSDGYRNRLNNPTPWSTQMMPKHLNMVRSQSRIVVSHGGGIAGHLITLRISPNADTREALQQTLDRELQAASSLRGVTGAHLLFTDTPTAAPTREQLMRGSSDQAADWIVLLNGYNAEALQQVRDARFSDAQLIAAGAKGAALQTQHQLAFTLNSRDPVRYPVKYPE